MEWCFYYSMKERRRLAAIIIAQSLSKGKGAHFFTADWAVRNPSLAQLVLSVEPEPL